MFKRAWFLFATAWAPLLMWGEPQHPVQLGSALVVVLYFWPVRGSVDSIAPRNVREVGDVPPPDPGAVAPLPALLALAAYYRAFRH